MSVLKVFNNCLVGLLLSLLASVHASRIGFVHQLKSKPDDESLMFPRPPYEERALMARWLVHETTWGVLATIDKQSGAPVSGLVSHSDGPMDSATGRIFTYITPMDELTQNILADPRCSFTVSEQQLRGHARPCGGLDPEDAACARATLLGRLLPVTEADRAVAQSAVFARHPQMADWPAGHNFDFYELHVEEVHVLDWYGGMAYIDGPEYYAAEVEPSRSAKSQK